MTTNKENLDPYHEALNAKTAEEYFSLPKEKREERGFYVKPFSLRTSWASLLGEEDCEWDILYKEIRKRYPIQWFFRDWLFTAENPVVYALYRTKKTMKEIFYKIKAFFKPVHPRFHKVYPRWEYKDLSQVIEEVLFAIILDFWYEEVVDGPINWDSDEDHKAFYEWLKESVHWIENTYPEYMKEHDRLLNCFSSDVEHDKYYDLCRKMEGEVRHILSRMITFRNFFWT